MMRGGSCPPRWITRWPCSLCGMLVGVFLDVYCSDCPVFGYCAVCSFPAVHPLYWLENHFFMICLFQIYGGTSFHFSLPKGSYNRESAKKEEAGGFGAE